MTGSILPMRHAIVARTGTSALCRLGQGSCRRAVLGLAAWLFAVVAAGNTRPVAAANVIESIYKVAGSHAVNTASVTDAGGAVIYHLSYPTHLGAGDLRHPIITWGNGTNALPSNYWGLLHHLASWGFVAAPWTLPIIVPDTLGQPVTTDHAAVFAETVPAVVPYNRREARQH